MTWLRRVHYVSAMGIPVTVDLVVQGGGSRSVFAAGALDALNGLPYRVNRAYGTSAGAIVAAYYLCDQIEDLRRLFLHHLTADRIIYPQRVWKVVDIDRLCDVMASEVPLKVPADGLALTVTVTDIQTGLPDYFDVQSFTEAEIYKCLAASAAIPLLYGRSIEFRSRKYIDGGMSDPLPLQRAVDESVQERIFAVSTRPAGNRQDKEELWRRIPKQLLALHLGRKAVSLIGAEGPLYNRTVTKLEAGEYAPQVVAVRPEAGPGLGRTEAGSSQLASVWNQGFIAAKTAFQHSD